MTSHLAFRTRSTQGTALAEWLNGTLVAFRGDAADPFRLLSVGSGTGILDGPVVAALQGAGPVTFVGIDPNRAENEMCRTAVGNVLAAGSSCTVIDGIIEEYEIEAPFDALSAVHIFYYSPDMTGVLKTCLAALKPGGRFFILNAPNNALSAFFAETTQHLRGFAPCLSDRLVDELEALGARVSVETVPGRVDISALDAPESETAGLLIDFIIHADTRNCPEEVREAYRRKLLDLSYVEEGTRWLPHNVDGIIAERT